LADQRPAAGHNQARKSIASFKLREGHGHWLSRHLRGIAVRDDRSPISIALPRIRAFAASTAQFDGRGNFAMGVREQDHLPRDRL